MSRVKIHESDNWTVEKDTDGKIIVSYFEDGHYRGEIEINAKDEPKVVRHD